MEDQDAITEHKAQSAKALRINRAAAQLADEYEVEGNPRAARGLRNMVSDLSITSKARLFDILQSAG